jgi:hypothetical protein
LQKKGGSTLARAGRFFRLSTLFGMQKGRPMAGGLIA